MKYLMDAHSGTLVDEFGPDQLREVRKAMVEAGLLRKTINGYQTSIVQMFGWGVSRRFVPAGIWYELKAVGRLVKGKTVAKDNPKKTAAPWKDVEAVFPHLHQNEECRRFWRHWCGFTGGSVADRKTS
ncbi:hypothetical protein R5W23_000095 [Gemmata sp. JC673]|uniref:Uncharacterized protein n=1 Tax=Gemmata algarum TaxID=2975278 RepID=A0ABU5EQE7_9BACT|nr:hypothetical protein [Gemmata algarum]MDY3557568.1 hypothetical protein [Gemmata algarum]